MTELLLRLCSVAELLLSLAMVVSGRSWRLLYLVQCVVIALTAGLGAIEGGDVALLGAVPILLLQAVAIPRLLRSTPHPAPPPSLPTLGAGVVLAALALSAPVPERFAAPLAMVLLGLLGAAAPISQRFGTLLVLNGASAAACLAPDGWLVVLLLAIVAAEGVPRLSALR